MRKLLLIFTLIIASLAPEVMNATSNWWVGGRLGYWHDKNKELDLTTNHLYIKPEVGYMFSEKIGVGLVLGYEYSEVEVDGFKSNLNSFIVNPFLRYKYCNFEKVSFFLDLGAGVAMGNHHGVEFGITPGIEIKPLPNIGILGTCGFLGYKSRYFNPLDSKTDGFGFDFNSNDVTIGIIYYF